MGRKLISEKDRKRKMGEKMPSGERVRNDVFNLNLRPATLKDDMVTLIEREYQATGVRPTMTDLINRFLNERVTAEIAKV